MKHALAPGLVALFVTTTLHAATVDLRILETTDLHSNMMDFDYYKDTPTDKFGLVRTASLIHGARQEATNIVLVDNGDMIQGSPLGDYMAAKGLQQGEVHPVYLAMNRLDYAVGNIGNHEFNYGLDYLHKALSGAAFPYVNANVLDAKTGKPLFTPYLIRDTPVKDRDGKTHTLRIGYIGFVPPQIMVWDKAQPERQSDRGRHNRNREEVGARNAAERCGYCDCHPPLRPFWRAVQGHGTT